MKVLTLHQPWASLVALGVKTIETRSWSTNLRGRIAIHAAQRPCPIVQFVGDHHVAQGGTWLHGGPHDVRMPFGAIVATAELVDCVPMIDHTKRHLEGLRGPVPYPHVHLYGDGVVGLARREDELCEWLDDQKPYGDFAHGRWAWLLEDVQPLAEPVPFRGGQGLTREWTP